MTGRSSRTRMWMGNYRGSECNGRRGNRKQAMVDETTNGMMRYDKASEAKKKECRCTKVNNKWIIKR